MTYTYQEVEDLKMHIIELETRLELRDKRIAEQTTRAELAEAECSRWKAIADNAIESENITIEKLTLTEIELDSERDQKIKVELLLETEKALTLALEDVVKMTANLRQQT